MSTAGVYGIVAAVLWFLAGTSSSFVARGVAVDDGAASSTPFSSRRRTSTLRPGTADDTTGTGGIWSTPLEVKHDSEDIESGRSVGLPAFDREINRSGSGKDLRGVVALEEKKIEVDEEPEVTESASEDVDDDDDQDLRMETIPLE